MKRRRRWFASVAALTALAQANTTSGQTYTWTNAAGGSWAGANWDVPPVSSAGAELFFGDPIPFTTFYSASNNIGPFQLTNLTFESNGSVGTTAATVLTISGSAGNPIQFLANGGTFPEIRQNGSATILITAALEFQSNTTIKGSGLGILAIGTLTGTSGGEVSGTGNVTIDRPSTGFPSTGGYTYWNPATTAGFSGNLILQNGNLILGGSSPIGSGSLIVAAGGTHSLLIAGTSVISNNITLNGNLNLAGSSGSSTVAATIAGAIGGAGGINVRTIGQSSTGVLISLTGANSFAGPLVVRPEGYPLSTGTTLSLSGAAGSATASSGYEVYLGGILAVNNTTANLNNRLNSGAALNVHAGGFTLTGNSGANSTESLSALNSSGLATITLSPSGAFVPQITFTSWNRQPNATALFVGGANFGSAGASNASRVIISSDPGGAVGGGLALTQKPVLPYAVADVGASATTPNRAMVTYDSASGRIVPISIGSGEYVTNYYINADRNPLGNFRSSGTNSYPIPYSLGVGGMNLASTVNSFILNASAGITGAGSMAVTSGALMFTNETSAFQGGVPIMMGLQSVSFGPQTGYLHTYLDTDFVSSISGSAGLVVTGRSFIHLASPTNTFTGGLTLSGGGGVIAASSANLGNAANSITFAGGALALSATPYATDATASQFTVSRAANITTGGGALATNTINNLLSYTGQITGSGPLILLGLGQVQLSNITNSFNGNITVFGTSGTSMYLRFASEPALGALGNNLILNSGVLQTDAPVITNRNILMLGIGGTGGGVFYTPGSNSLTVNGVVSGTVNANNATTSPFNANSPLLKVGAANLFLNAANTYTGATTIGDATPVVRNNTASAETGGWIILSGPTAAISQTSSVTLNPGTTLWLDNTSGKNANRVSNVPFTIRGGTLLFTGETTSNNSENIGAVTVTGGTGNFMLVQQGTGSVSTVMNAISLATFTGTSPNEVFGLAIFRGDNLGQASGKFTQMRFGIAPALVNSLIPFAVGGATASGGPTDFVTYGANGVEIFGSYGSLASPGDTVTANQSGGSFPLAGNISLNALRLTNNGQVNLNGFTITLGSTALGGMVLSAPGGTQQLTGGTLAFGARQAVFISEAALSVSSALTGTKGLFKAGNGMLTLSGSGAGLSGTQFLVGNGILRYGAANALPTTAALTVNAGASLDINGLTVTLTSLNGFGGLALGAGTLNLSTTTASVIGGPITGTAASSIVKTGTATMTLAGDNSGFNGSITIQNGLASVQTPTALGSSVAPFPIGNGTTTSTNTGLQFGPALLSFPRNLTVVANSIPAVLDTSTAGTIALTGDIAINSAAVLRLFGQQLGSSSLTGPSANLTGTISGPGSLEIERGTFRIAGNNTYAGTTTFRGPASAGLANFMIVGVAHDNAFSTGQIVVAQSSASNTANVYLRADGGARTLANNFFFNSFGVLNVLGANNLTLSGTIDLNSIGSSRNFTIQSAGVTTFSGPVLNGGISKDGAGTLVLTGTMTGTVNVSAGMLLVNGTAGAASVGGGAVLGGSGTVASLVPSFFQTAVVSPGGDPVAARNGTSILSSTGTVNFQNTGTTLLLDLNGASPGTGYDQLRVGQAGVSTTINLNGAALLVNLGFDPNGTTFTLVNNLGDSFITGTFSGQPEGSTVLAGTFNSISYSGTISYVGGTGNDVTLTFAPVPEPAGLLAMLGFAGCFAGLRRRA